MLSRKEFLYAGAVSVAFTAVAPSAAFGATGIRVGVHPYDQANPANPTMEGGFRAFKNGEGIKPYYVSEWNRTASDQASFLEGWHGEDITQLAQNLGVGLQFNMEVRPDKDTGVVWADLLSGGSTLAGIDADQYVTNVGRHLQSYCTSTGRVVPLRLLNEFNSFTLSDGHYGGASTMKALWKRWRAILIGGDVAGRIANLGQPAYRGTNPAPRNDNLRFCWSMLVLARNPVEWKTFYPGDSFVDQVGADIYPSYVSASRQAQFDLLNAVHTFAKNHAKEFCVPEFNWHWYTFNETGKDGAYPMKLLLDWMISTPNVRWVSQFEWDANAAVVQHGDPHLDLRLMYINYYDRPNFVGGA